MNSRHWMENHIQSSYPNGWYIFVFVIVSFRNLSAKDSIRITCDLYPPVQKILGEGCNLHRSCWVSPICTSIKYWGSGNIWQLSVYESRWSFWYHVWLGPCYIEEDIAWHLLTLAGINVFIRALDIELPKQSGWLKAECQLRGLHKFRVWGRCGSLEGETINEQLIYNYFDDLQISHLPFKLPNWQSLREKCRLRSNIVASLHISSLLQELLNSAFIGRINCLLV